MKEWNIQINYGIKTGFNPAFIIDSETRNAIIADCVDESELQRTKELIRPMLRGRNIKKYGYDGSSWLIGTFPAKKYNIDNFPAVKRFLLSFSIEKLEQTGTRHIINGVEIKARKKCHGKWFGWE